LSSRNPFGDFRRECEKTLIEALTRTKLELPLPRIALQLPPTPEFGELSSSICFELSKSLKKKPRELAKTIANKIDKKELHLIEKVEAAGEGYVNFHANYPTLSRLTIESARKAPDTYGHVRAKHPFSIIIEHTSGNPAGPIHVGTARNSVIGDTLARLLKARGHKIKTHFYIDDVGRQVAVAAYGYKTLGQPQPIGKPDHWIGLVYAITNCITEIQKLKKRIEELKEESGSEEELSKIQRELDSWVAAAAFLRDANSELFDALMDEMKKDENPEEKITNIMRLYEEGEEEVKELVRKVVTFSIDGFKETYKRFGISWDSWDWESDLVWNRAVSEAVGRLSKTPYVKEYQGVLSLDVDQVVRKMDLKKLFGIPKEYEVSPLVLTRSDGTTLYTTRDIAYSLRKLGLADKVINVIGVEQTLSQIQLRIAISILASPEKAKSQLHYAYELVDLPGYKMSRRRGRYVTLDEVLDESVSRAYEEVKKCSPMLWEEEKRRIAESVGVGAVKYALLSVDPLKKLAFTWDKVLNFEMNSAPFVQYAYARACSIMKRAGRGPEKPDYSLLRDPLERELVRIVAYFPEVFVNACRDLKLSPITEFANNLAAKFNSFYAHLPVIRAASSGLRDTRLALVDAVKIAMKNALNILGIEALEKM